MTSIPRLPALPLLGGARELLAHPGKYLLDGYRRLGPVFEVRFFHLPIIALLGPDANRMILVDRREAFSHAEGYAIVRKVLGDGLLFQDGDRHRRNRGLMTPAFHQRGVNAYFDLMSECVREHLARWGAEGVGLMHERFRHLTFEIMARLILGVDGSLDLAPLSERNDAMARGISAFLRVNWPGTRYGRGVRARDELHAYLRGVIAARRGNPGDDALGRLLAARDENGDALSDDELLDQAIILMFAGHETTTSMLTSLLLVLRDRPELEARLREEQRRVIGDDEVTLDHLKDLPLLDCVLKEVERCFPPVSVCMRGVLEDLDFEGFRLPRGSAVFYSPWASHRLPQVFAEPERFSPDRFAPPREEHKATPYSLVGFGGGPRLCLGQAFSQLEMKIVAARLLQGYEWRVASGDPRLRYTPTLHPRTGLPGQIRHSLRVSRRS